MAENITEEAVVVIKADTTELNNAIDRADKRADEMQGKFKKVGEVAGTIGDKLSAGVIRAQNAWQAFAAKLNTGGIDKTAKAQEQAAKNTEKMTVPLKTATTLSEKLAQTWQKLNTKDGGLSKEAEQTREKIRQIEYALRRIGEKKIPTQAWKDYQKELTDAKKRVEDVEASVKSSLQFAREAARRHGWNEDEAEQRTFNSPGVQEKIQRQRDLADAYNEVYAKGQKLIEQGLAFKDMTQTAPYQKLTEDLEMYKTKLEEVSNTGITPLQNAFSKIGSTLASAGSKIGKTFGSLLVKAVKKAGSAIKSFFSSVRQHAKDNALVKAVGNIGAAFTRLFTMIKTRIKRTLVTAIFNDVKATFAEIATINPQFNDSISRMVNSARQLGAQILAIFEPIIIRLAPLIERGAEFLTNVADTLSQFTAKMFGFDTYTKAEKGQYDYAKSVDKTTDSTKNATKATKEYAKTVMGFDQLNKLGDTDETDTLADSADAVLNKAEVNAEKAKSIGEKIWDAFNNHDYKGAGEAMAEAVNSAFDWLGNTFGWSKNMDVLTEKINNFGDTVNGFIGGLDTIDIGKNIADIINTGINGLDLLLNGEHKINFKQLGEKVGQLLISGFQNIQWETLGKDIAGALNGLGEAITGALTTTVKDAEGNEQTLGEALGTALRDLFKGAVETWNVDTFSDTVSSIINTLADFFATAFGDADTAALFGAKLGQSISETLKKIDPDKMEAAIHNFFYSLGRMLGEFVKNVDWAAVLTALWNGIKAAVEGVSDAVDDMIFGEMKTRESVLNLYKNADLNLDERLEIQNAVASGKRYSTSTLWAGDAEAQMRQEQIRQRNLTAIGDTATGANSATTQQTDNLIGGLGNLNDSIKALQAAGIKVPDVVLKVNDREIARANMTGTQKMNQQYNGSYGY